MNRGIIKAVRQPWAKGPAGLSNRVIIASLLVLLAGTRAVFAQTALPEPVFIQNAAEKVPANSYSLIGSRELAQAMSFLWNYGADNDAGYIEYTPSMILAAAATTDAEIPGSIRNNKYFLESVRLANLAQEAYEEGDYDASTGYSEQAVRYAQLSDEYVRLQLKIKEADDAIAAARRRLDYADSVNAASRYFVEYSQAQTAYTAARTLRAAESWDEAIAAANQVLAVLAFIEGEPEKADGPLPLPAQYTVRTWAGERDCLWNIAGRSWVYNDPRKWKILFEANKPKMPQDNNPDLINPGMVLDIPSIQGETRQGMWDSTKMYSPLQ